MSSFYDYTPEQLLLMYQQQFGTVLGLPFAWLLLPSSEALDCLSLSITVLSIQGNVVSVSVMLPGGADKVVIDIKIGE